MSFLDSGFNENQFAHKQYFNHPNLKNQYPFMNQFLKIR